MPSPFWSLESFLLVLRLILLVVVLLILVLLLLIVLLLVLLILLFLLVLLLLLLLFLQLLDLSLHEIAIVFRVRVAGFDLQRGVIRLHRFLPGLDRLLRILFLGLLAEPVFRVAEVVISVLLHRHLLGLEALLKTRRGLRIVAGFVSSRAGIELELGLRRFFRGGRGILLLRLREITFLVSLLGRLR